MYSIKIVHLIELTFNVIHTTVPETLYIYFPNWMVSELWMHAVLTLYVWWIMSEHGVQMLVQIARWTLRERKISDSFQEPQGNSYNGFQW